jgi:hypothetical protein
MHLDAYPPRPAHLKWLLDSDPAIRWQVMNTLPMKALKGQQPNGPALQLRVGEPNSSAANLPTAAGVGWIKTQACSPPSTASSY